MVLGILFLILSNTNIQFPEKKLIWKSYIAVKALSTTKQIKLMNKNEFAKTTFDVRSKTFVMYVTALEILVHLIKKTQIAFLFTKKVMIPNEYSDYTDVFLKEKTLLLPKQIKFN